VGPRSERPLGRNVSRTRHFLVAMVAEKIPMVAVVENG